MRPGPSREGAGRGRREDPGQAQQEQVEQGRTIPGNLARAGQGRGNMEQRRGQFHKHRQGQGIGNHNMAARRPRREGWLESAQSM